MTGTIVTKYLGATDTRGSRVKAISSSGVTLTISWDHALNATENHVAAARALAKKISDEHPHGWRYSINEEEAGLLPESLSYGYVFLLKGEPA